MGQALLLAGQACVWGGIALGRSQSERVVGFSPLDFGEGFLLGCGIVLMLAATALNASALTLWRREAREPG